MPIRFAVAAAALLVIAAGCSSDEASAPPTGGVATPPPDTAAATTTTTPTTTPITTTRPTTTPPTTTPAPTTTEVPGRREPTGRTAGVFAATPGSVDRGWVPLGGWTGGDFVDATESNAPQWSQGREIRVTRLGADPIGSEIGSDAASCAGADGPRIRVPVNPIPPAGSGFGAVAVEGTWPLRPRPVLRIDADIPGYVDAARDLLRGRAPRSIPGDVVQIVLADMNGNGEETSIIVFESGDAPGPDGSGFSLLFSFDNETGRIAEIDSDVVDPPPPPTADPGPDGAAPPGVSTTSSTSTTTTTLPPPPPLERFRVLEVADLNGDRVYELITKSWSADEHTVRLHELANGVFDFVGESSCDR